MGAACDGSGVEAAARATSTIGRRYRITFASPVEYGGGRGAPVWDNPPLPMKTLRFSILLAASFFLAAATACGGVDRTPSLAASPADASTADASPADASPADASTADASAPAPAACGVGTWIFNENGDPCGACVLGISDFVTLTVPPGMVDGGSVSDSEGNTWQYDPVACTLTTTGICGIADTIDFGKRATKCAWTCGEACPACAGQCNYAPY